MVAAARPKLQPKVLRARGGVGAGARRCLEPRTRPLRGRGGWSGRRRGRSGRQPPATGSGLGWGNTSLLGTPDARRRRGRGSGGRRGSAGAGPPAPAARAPRAPYLCSNHEGASRPRDGPAVTLDQAKELRIGRELLQRCLGDRLKDVPRVMRRLPKLWCSCSHSSSEEWLHDQRMSSARSTRPFKASALWVGHSGLSRHHGPPKCGARRSTRAPPTRARMPTGTCHGMPPPFGPSRRVELRKAQSGKLVTERW